MNIVLQTLKESTMTPVQLLEKRLPQSVHGSLDDIWTRLPKCAEQWNSRMQMKSQSHGVSALERCHYPVYCTGGGLT